jgi:hypothetical protein
MPSVRVICPYCNAKLRVSTEGGLNKRAKCRACKNSFTPNYVVDEPVGPRPDAASAAAAAAVLPFTAAPPAAPPADAPPLTTPPLTTPPPAIDTPAGRRRRKERIVEERPAGQLRPYEVVLASALILAVLAGLGVLGYQLYSQPAAGDRLAGDDPDQAAAAAEPYTPPTADLAPKERPKRLTGAWELRSDDGRSGRLVLRPDGTLIASSTGPGDSALPDYTGKWFLLKKDGSRYELEFGQERGGVDGYRVTLLLAPTQEAFTLAETVKSGIATRVMERFVRVAAAPAVTPDGGPPRP